jgi:hypothetical protein
VIDRNAIPFRAIWTCDTEFQAPPGERPHVLCVVARELRTGREIRLWRDELVKLPAAPFDVGPNSVFIAFFASAELGCFLQLGWKLPANVVDLFCEHRVVTNGLGVRNSLLDALAQRGLASMESTEKEAKRALIMEQQEWSAAEIDEILAYCAADATTTEALLLRMVEGGEISSWPHSLWRGRYMAAVARMEHEGIPIDSELHDALAGSWDELKAALVRTVDAAYGVYDGTAFREERFTQFLVRHRISWPCHPSGRLVLDRQTFSDQAKAYPTLLALHELRKTLAMMRLTDLAVGSDSRNRALLSPFSAKTGRNIPSNSKFIFGAAKWLRGLIRPPPGHGLAYLDWQAQEFAIAAALSGDERMIADYAAGDPHLGFAKAARLAPPEATKETHPLIRERCKTTNLGVLYGMKEHGLAARLNIPISDAGELLRLHHGTYRRFWSWSDAVVTTALLRREIHTAFGWRMRTTAETQPRTLQNWMMQSVGAEMMRGAAIAATESGLSIAAPVHDAFLLVVPLDRLESDAGAMMEIMRGAGKVATGGIEVRVDCRLDMTRFGEAEPTTIHEMWFLALKLLAEIMSVSSRTIHPPNTIHTIHTCTHI